VAVSSSSLSALVGLCLSVTGVVSGVPDSIRLGDTVCLPYLSVCLGKGSSVGVYRKRKRRLDFFGSSDAGRLEIFCELFTEWLTKECGGFIPAKLSHSANSDVTDREEEEE